MNLVTYSDIHHQWRIYWTDSLYPNFTLVPLANVGLCHVNKDFLFSIHLCFVLSWHVHLSLYQHLCTYLIVNDAYVARPRCLKDCHNFEHNRCAWSILDRILVPCYSSLLIKIKYRIWLIYSNSTLSTVSNFNRTIRLLTVLIEYINLFCRVHFSKQGFKICASAVCYLPIKLQIC